MVWNTNVLTVAVVTTSHELAVLGRSQPRMWNGMKYDSAGKV